MQAAKQRREMRRAHVKILCVCSRVCKNTAVTSVKGRWASSLRARVFVHKTSKTTLTVTWQLCHGTNARSKTIKKASSSLLLQYRQALMSNSVATSAPSFLSGHCSCNTSLSKQDDLFSSSSQSVPPQNQESQFSHIALRCQTRATRVGAFRSHDVGGTARSKQNSFNISKILNNTY